MFPLVGEPRKIGSRDEDDAREMVGGRPGPRGRGVALDVCDLHRHRFSLIRSPGVEPFATFDNWSILRNPS
jgi:hypothetical protein